MKKPLSDSAKRIVEFIDKNPIFYEPVIAYLSASREECSKEECEQRFNAALTEAQKNTANSAEKGQNHEA